MWNSFRDAIRRHCVFIALFGAMVAVYPTDRVVSQGFSGGPFLNGIPTGPSITGLTDTLSGLYFGTNRVGFSGHLEAGLKTALGQPALTACGTTPVLATGSTDSAGTITMGTTATGCVITFGTAYAAVPSCTVTWQATPLASQSYTVTTTAITTVQTSTTNNLLNYTCVAKSGG